jgi:hypothetical protein
MIAQQTHPGRNACSKPTNSGREGSPFMRLLLGEPAVGATLGLDPA